MDKITLVTFTDPMPGMSYECEPIFRKLETHFAIRKYNAKLAQIYLSEESIGGLPINMTGFELFSVNETAAFKAAEQLVLPATFSADKAISPP